eukprot:3091634-Alexandrium_andersonii.AAC.1
MLVASARRPMRAGAMRPASLTTSWRPRRARPRPSTSFEGETDALGESIVQNNEAEGHIED